jgi:hypothetical protein
MRETRKLPDATTATFMVSAWVVTAMQATARKISTVNPVGR